jgi:hypothetical protein
MTELVVIEKEYITEIITAGPVDVTFTKKDGTVRLLKCTLSPALLPTKTVDDESVIPVKVRKVSENSLAVYDLINTSWKSFRWDSIICVKIAN